MNSLKINHLAVLVSVVAMHILGFLWYGVLFQTAWMNYVGITPENMNQNQPSPAIWVLNLIAIVAPIYVLAWLYTKLTVADGVRGALIAFLITFCVHLLPEMNSNMFARAPFGLAWITAGYTLVGLTISGFILGAWTKKAV
jgi:hypothetical protein